MSLEEIKKYSFAEQDYDSWKQKVEESLKGKKIDSLNRTTYENIQLKPLYTKEDRNGKLQSLYPGLGDFRRGSKTLGYIEEGWKIAQRIDTTDAEEFKKILTSTLQKGQDAIAFTPSSSILKELSQLEIPYDQIPFCVNGEDYHVEMIDTLSKWPKADQISGYIGMDPVSLFAQKDFQNREDVYQRFANAIKKARNTMPKLKTILVDSTVYHNGGANAVQELAISIATAVYHIERLKTECLSANEIAEKIVFHFSIGNQFFMEVAKLRAARVLWSRITDAYDLPKDLQGGIEISADTSWYTKTVYDPNVNLLRAGNEAFAAVLGGIQYLHVSPFNEPEGAATDFSDRIARNTQLLLKSEARLGSIVDPAGGSYYIESLTDELVEKAWALFLEIEEKGSIIDCLTSNWIQSEIASVKNKRQQDTFTRKQSIVGTNNYANLQDNPLQMNTREDTANELAIPQERLSEPFENLRFKSAQLTKAGHAPVGGLICVGSLPTHKARADFIEGFLAPGGILVERSQEIQTAQEAISFINEKKCDFYVLCGADTQYEQTGLTIIKSLKEKYPKTKLYLAGTAPNGEQEAWKEQGIADFITVKSNCYETLLNFLNEIEVEKVHE